MKYYRDMTWTYGKRRQRRPDLTCLWLAIMVFVLVAALAVGIATMGDTTANGSGAGANAVTADEITND